MSIAYPLVLLAVKHHFVIMEMENQSFEHSENDSDLHVLIEFINKTLHEQKDNSIHLNTVSSLWIILFALIITQKIFKYVIKPCQARHQNNENEQQPNRDPSVECLVV